MDETTSNPSQIKSTLTDYEEMRKNAELTPSELRAALRAQIAGAQLSRISALPADQAHHCLPTSSSVPTSSSTTFTLTSSKLTAPHSYITTTSSTTSTAVSLHCDVGWSWEHFPQMYEFMAAAKYVLIMQMELVLICNGMRQILHSAWHYDLNQALICSYSYHTHTHFYIYQYVLTSMCGSTF